MKLKKLFLWIIIIFLFITCLPSSTYANHWVNIEAIDIKANSATLMATVEENSTNPANYWFQYSRNPEPSSEDWITASVDKVDVAGDRATITANLTYLEEHTTYKFRAIYVDDSGFNVPLLGWLLDGLMDLITEDVSVEPSQIEEFTTLEIQARELRLTPVELSENTLNGSLLSLTVSGGAFSSGITRNNLQLNNPPPGTSLMSVERTADNVLHLILDHDGTDFDTDYADFTITIEEGGFAESGTMTSDAIHVKALTEVDGYNTYTSTGQSYPTEIEMTGYNIREKDIHYNATLYTEMSVQSSTATFDYFVGVYDQNGEQIGNAGTYDHPLSVETATGSQEVVLTDEIISLTGTLTPGYRIVIVVKEVNLK